MECIIQAVISSVVCVYKTTTLYGYTAYSVWWDPAHTPNVSI